MKIVAIAASAALLLTGMPPVLAQTANKAPPRGEHARHHPAPNAEDLAAYAEARIAALRAGLQLNAEQEKHWPALETALRENAASFAERVRDRQANRDERPDALDRLERQAEQMSAQAQRVQKLITVAKPLFESLDDAQKRRFGVLIRDNVSPGHRR